MAHRSRSAVVDERCRALLPTRALRKRRRGGVVDAAVDEHPSRLTLQSGSTGGVVGSRLFLDGRALTISRLADRRHSLDLFERQQ